jgi:hypothetical protein
VALFTIERIAPLPVEEAWRRLTDWERHASVVPLTRIALTTPPPTGPGTVFVARSGVGRVAVDDPMEVVVWHPPLTGTPGRCRLEKRGTFVTGWAEIEVRAYGAGSRAVWTERLRVRGLPSLLDAPLARAGRVVFGRAVAKLLAGPGD